MRIKRSALPVPKDIPRSFEPTIWEVENGTFLCTYWHSASKEFGLCIGEIDLRDLSNWGEWPYNITEGTCCSSVEEGLAMHGYLVTDSFPGPNPIDRFIQIARDSCKG